MPRSPSRDLSDRFTGKRGYFRRPDALRRGKIALGWMALFAAGAWAAVDFVKPAQRVQYAHSHGPLANPHASFDDNCAACHVAHGLKDLGPVSVFNARARWHDLTCEKCHSGPGHHDSANADARAFHDRCSNCHHDHNGRLSSLVRLADKDCNQCHANLGKWHEANKSKAGKPYQNEITNFVKDHPEFRSLDTSANPRTLKFSHAIHMNPGQAYTADGKEAMTVKRLRELNGEAGKAAVARYASGAGDDTKVQLQCASCHALDSGVGSPGFNSLKDTLAKDDPTRALLPPRAEGAYFLPVNFEAHCRSCHPQKANEGVSEANGKKFEVPRFDVPHRKQPADLIPDLKAGYLKGLSNSGHPALNAPPELGGKLDAPPKNLAPRTLGEEAERLAGLAEGLLFEPAGSCAKCHTMTPGDGKAKPRVTAVPDRTVWFKHAKFNHASHRGTTCATCHPGTGADYISKVEADKPEPVQIVGINTCRACHSPLGTKIKVSDSPEVLGGGARHNCTDCHRYHNGDHPLQGRGAPARDASKPLDLLDWLKGSSK
ncbi:Uncharacterized protein OS=Isosphaera pallida (strain ATCC 43644 / DSM 9630 / IS1B) GN=Isop_3162 PE=4 SV=1: Cytochrome_C7 [Gemmata massiliana]|uniref:Cytochrome c7-like domain-containing protein n=1 Tax=Gemmata massiliana TaxID=1210884 RepID=A0A6P2CTR2_9BACT|nr:cytochrome c3 family protein [Gemmata massiliana]VTR92293.1 Uncharacterized protein OS=Isosphaera pallida (strain ATCC 43644 / DSM 9630 / IS1B) GN=Isop_3162 PE=4 SV=1: Cytochrome_C7 [Gemmata massiliana]